jgi:hypothetical protein
MRAWQAYSSASLHEGEGTAGQSTGVTTTRDQPFEELCAQASDD